MAVLRQQAIPLANYPTGERQFGPIAIPDTARSLYFEVARCTSLDPSIWPNVATQLQIDFEGSSDGGVIWTPAGGGGGFGGIFVLRNGSELAIMTVIAALPAVPGRQIRINTAIINGPLRTQGFIELRD